MQIETYEIEIESENECREALVNKLGLKKDSNKSIFRSMTLEEKTIFMTLFPVATPIEDYELSPIPLRVLEFADRATTEGLELIIWHEAVVTDDPVLVGYEPGSSTWNRDYKLIARWGSALDEWPALVSKFYNVCNAQIINIEAEIASMKTIINERALKYTGNKFDPSFFRGQ